MTAETERVVEPHMTEHEAGYRSRYDGKEGEYPGPVEEKRLCPVQRYRRVVEDALEEKEREKAAFGPNFASDSDQDPVKAEADRAAVKLLAQQEGEGESLAPRQHPSDKSGDTKCLDRAGDRNLYLLLKTKGDETWRFPQGGVEKDDLLHQVSSLLWVY